MAAYYLWFKGIHIAFMVTWFAGLFYLPRLFIYHVQAADSASRERFQIMEKRLFGIMTIGAALTWVFGLTMAGINPPVAETPWFLTKFALVVGLVVYHWRCWVWIKRLAASDEVESDKWLRWYNEIPVAFLFAIILLAVVKPF